MVLIVIKQNQNRHLTHFSIPAYLDKEQIFH
jgi:hypothetical protein